MKNNVYVRSNRSIFTISITRIIFLLPLIIYGLYKNGIHLYLHEYINFINIFKPLLIIFGGGLIAALINIIYEKIIKKNKEDIISVMFSSFHIEYGIILGCLMPININLIIYFSVLTIIFFISKFLNNRINTICVCFIIIYILSTIFGEFIYENIYELDKKFSLEFIDYLIGRGAGGIAATHIILLIIAFFGIHITNNNKSSITITSILAITISFIILALATNTNFNTLIFSNNLIFIMTYVITDSVTSCYTINGKIAFGIICGILTFIIHFLNPILAPFIAILITSLFNNLIDRKINLIFKKNLH